MYMHTCVSGMSVCVRCVLCTRFLRPPVSAPKALAEGTAAAGTAAAGAAALATGAAMDAAVAGEGTVPTVPGAANGVTARRN